MIKLAKDTPDRYEELHAERDDVGDGIQMQRVEMANALGNFESVRETALTVLIEPTALDESGNWGFDITLTTDSERIHLFVPHEIIEDNGDLLNAKYPLSPVQHIKADWWRTSYGTMGTQKFNVLWSMPYNTAGRMELPEVFAHCVTDIEAL